MNLVPTPLELVDNNPAFGMIFIVFRQPFQQFESDRLDAMTALIKGVEAQRNRNCLELGGKLRQDVNVIAERQESCQGFSVQRLEGDCRRGQFTENAGSCSPKCSTAVVHCTLQHGSIGPMQQKSESANSLASAW